MRWVAFTLPALRDHDEGSSRKLPRLHRHEDNQTRNGEVVQQHCAMTHVRGDPQIAHAILAKTTVYLPVCCPPAPPHPHCVVREHRHPKSSVQRRIIFAITHPMDNQKFHETLLYCDRRMFLRTAPLQKKVCCEKVQTSRRQLMADHKSHPNAKDHLTGYLGCGLPIDHAGFTAPSERRHHRHHHHHFVCIVQCPSAWCTLL